MRSTRAIALAVAALELAALTLAQARGWGLRDVLVAFGCALFSGSLAADLAAGDAAAGRLRTLASLPVRPLDLWIARVLYWLAATVVFTLLTIAAVMGLSSLFEGISGRPVDSVQASSLAIAGLASALVAGSVAFAMGTLVPHPLGATILTTLIVAGVAWFSTSLADYLRAVDFDASALEVGLTLAAFGALFLAVSAVVFTGWRVPAAPRRRAVVRGLTTILVLTLAAASAGAWTVRAHLVNVPTRPARIQRMAPSPDGEFLAIASLGEKRQGRSSFVHVVETRTGEIRPVLDRQVYPFADWDLGCWNAAGQLLLSKPGWSLAEGVKAPDTVVVADPRTGEILDPDALDPKSFAQTKGWGTGRIVKRLTDPPRGRARAADRPVYLYEVSWPEAVKSMTFETRVPHRDSPYGVVFTKSPGVFLACDAGGALWRHDLSTQEKLRLHDGRVEAVWLSAAGDACLVQTESAATVVAVKTGAPIAGPFPARPYQAAFVPGPGGSRFVKIRNGDGTARLVDLESRAEALISTDAGVDGLVSLGAQQFAVARSNGAVDVIDAQGNALRSLVPSTRP
jgi:hypothetical protein